MEWISQRSQTTNNPLSTFGINLVTTPLLNRSHFSYHPSLRFLRPFRERKQWIWSSIWQDVWTSKRMNTSRDTSRLTRQCACTPDCSATMLLTMQLSTTTPIVTFRECAHSDCSKTTLPLPALPTGPKVSQTVLGQWVQNRVEQLPLWWWVRRVSIIFRSCPILTDPMYTDSSVPRIQPSLFTFIHITPSYTPSPLDHCPLIPPPPLSSFINSQCHPSPKMLSLLVTCCSTWTLLVFSLTYSRRPRQRSPRYVQYGTTLSLMIVLFCAVQRY